MLHVAPTRPTLRAIAFLAAGLLAACGSSRKVSESGSICLTCHGGANPAGNAAPPKSVNGATATSDVSVGAHQAHLVAGHFRGPIACDECHVVPANMQEHEAGIARIAAGTAQRVVFGPLGARNAPNAAWNVASSRCDNTYCHGAPLNHGGLDHAPSWTGAIAPDQCNTCHGYPPALPHPQVTTCGTCHSETTPDGVSIKIVGGVSTHIDGALTINAAACTACHGFPPTSGAHTLHTATAVAGYGDLRKTADALNAATTTYAFGCGNCHPLDWARHALHSLGDPAFVELTPAGATTGSLRALNLNAAAWNATTKTCAGTYCHSSGQATIAAPRTVPAWNAPSGSIGCGGCHGNPPNYANGGTGNATANSHIGLLDEGAGLTYEVGHFGGFPAMMHDWSRHGRGDWDSAPITCQTCHNDTADATHTGPSGFYYLDVTGDYNLFGTGRCFGGSGASCTGGTFLPWNVGYSCTHCHTATPPQGGQVRPYFHVNGTRDVSFDRRTTVTGLAPPFNAALAPKRPYWLTAPSTFTAINTTGKIDGTAINASGVTWSTLSVSLAGASWNASSKTCSSVDCHFNRTSVQWGEPLSSSPTTGTCNICHNF